MSTHNIHFCGELRNISVFLLKMPYMELWYDMYVVVIFRWLELSISPHSVTDSIV